MLNLHLIALHSANTLCSTVIVSSHNHIVILFSSDNWWTGLVMDRQTLPWTCSTCYSLLQGHISLSVWFWRNPASCREGHVRLVCMMRNRHCYDIIDWFGSRGRDRAQHLIFSHEIKKKNGSIKKLPSTRKTYLFTVDVKSVWHIFAYICNPNSNKTSFSFPVVWTDKLDKRAEERTDIATVRWFDYMSARRR